MGAGRESKLYGSGSVGLMKMDREVGNGVEKKEPKEEQAAQGSVGCPRGLGEQEIGWDKAPIVAHSFDKQTACKIHHLGPNCEV